MTKGTVLCIGVCTLLITALTACSKVKSVQPLLFTSKAELLRYFNYGEINEVNLESQRLFVVLACPRSINVTDIYCYVEKSNNLVLLFKSGFIHSPANGKVNVKVVDKQIEISASGTLEYKIKKDTEAYVVYGYSKGITIY